VLQLSWLQYGLLGPCMHILAPNAVPSERAAVASCGKRASSTVVHILMPNCNLSWCIRPVFVIQANIGQIRMERTVIEKYHALRSRQSLLAAGLSIAQCNTPLPNQAYDCNGTLAISLDVGGHHTSTTLPLLLA
jgi:hypothetical protein